jgi:AdoMet-dependent rRNA methyltransferase SPB1
MKTWKADTVLHDGAPNVGLGWVQDAFTQSQLTLQALKLAVENLVIGGTFVTKIFRSKDYNKLLWVFQQLFDKVEATKPPASRNVSAEIFVVCRGFKAPKKLDPRILDPREVFEELQEGNKEKQNEQKIYNPEKKKRSREGYEEGDYTLHKKTPIMEFIRADIPIDILATTNQFELDEENPEWLLIKKLKKTNKELLDCFSDLKVLGRKEFKNILKWRKVARALLKIDEDDKDEELVEVEELDEDAQIDKELDGLKQKQLAKLKRERRKRNETKQKEITRMQMDMLTPKDIGIEAASSGGESLFNLKQAEKTGILDDLIKGKKRMVFNKEELAEGNDYKIDSDHEGNESDFEVDNLEGQLDNMYDSYQQRRSERDASYRAKMARGDDDDDKWDGIEDKGSDEEEIEEPKDYDEETDSDLDSDDDENINKLITTLKNQKTKGLSDKASFLFNDSIFEGVEDQLPAAKVTQEMTPITSANDDSTTASLSDGDDDFDSSDDEASKIEYVSRSGKGKNEDSYDSDEDVNLRNHEKDVDIATTQAMTLAHKLALGQITKHDLVNDGFNRYSFRDQDGLPDWFLDDEKQHSKINKPITKEAALAIKEKMKLLNARPIKKVAEAKGRKKLRALRRLEKMKKKSDIINDDTDKSEKDKAEEISKLMRKLTKKQKTKPQVTYVFANGNNRGLSGRPKGIKGKYKMVDGVMKNEQRALRRIAKKHKK